MTSSSGFVDRGVAHEGAEKRVARVRVACVDRHGPFGVRRRARRHAGHSARTPASRHRRIVVRRTSMFAVRQRLRPILGAIRRRTDPALSRNLKPPPIRRWSIHLAPRTTTGTPLRPSPICNDSSVGSRRRPLVEGRLRLKHVQALSHRLAPSRQGSFGLTRKGTP